MGLKDVFTIKECPGDLPRKPTEVRSEATQVEPTDALEAILEAGQALDRVSKMLDEAQKFAEAAEADDPLAKELVKGVAAASALLQDLQQKVFEIEESASDMMSGGRDDKPSGKKSGGIFDAGKD